MCCLGIIVVVNNYSCSYNNRSALKSVTAQPPKSMGVSLDTLLKTHAIVDC